MAVDDKLWPLTKMIGKLKSWHGSFNTDLPILSFGQTWESLDISEPLKYRP